MSSILSPFDQRRREFDSNGHEWADEAVEIANEIRRDLIQCGTRPSDALYYPLADFLGRPFVVSPPTEVSEAIPKKKFERLRYIVSELAKRVLAAPATDFAKIDHTILVAGGARKAFPIYELLDASFESNEFPGHYSLVTDYWTARDLIAIARAATSI